MFALLRALLIIVWMIGILAWAFSLLLCAIADAYSPWLLIPWVLCLIGYTPSPDWDYVTRKEDMYWQTLDGAKWPEPHLWDDLDA